MQMFRRPQLPPGLPPPREGAPPMPDLPEIVEDDLLIDDGTWRASMGWEGDQAREAAQEKITARRARALSIHRSEERNWSLTRQVKLAEATACRYCGDAVAKDEAKMNSHDPWRHCPDCWAMLYRHTEQNTRRLAYARQLLPDLPADVIPADVDGCVLDYYSELPDTVATATGVPPWSWINLSVLDHQIRDNRRFRLAPKRAPDEYAGRMCGGCGVLLSQVWSSLTVPVLRAGQENEPPLPVCADCAPLLIRASKDVRGEGFDDRLFWVRALRLCDRVEAGWAVTHGFTSYAKRYCDADPEFHDFTRPFGWIDAADLAKVRDMLLTRLPSRAPDRETEARYRRKERMAFLAAHQEIEQIPEPPTFSTTAVAPPPDRPGQWHDE